MAKVAEDFAPVAQVTSATPKTSTPTKWRVTVKNPNYDGKTLGVQFVQGTGMLDVETIDPRLNKTLEQIVQEFKDLGGYTLTPIG